MKSLNNEEVKKDDKVNDEEKLYKDLLINEIKNKVKSKIDDDSQSVLRTIKFLMAQDELPKNTDEKPKP